MKTYHANAMHSVQVPMTVTKASDTLAAICHRNDTQQVIGDQTPGKYTDGYHIPIDYDAMGFIIGRELAENFVTAMRNPAFAEYFLKINARLVEVGIALAWTSEYWYLHKLPRFAPENEVLHIYTYQSLVTQAPAGFKASDN